MDFDKILPLIFEIIKVSSFIGGGLIALLLSQWLRPVIDIGVSTRWFDPEEGWITVRLEFENRARIKVRKKTILFQYLEYEWPNSGSLSEWVPFAIDAIPKEEKPFEWREPLRVCETTKVFAPKDRVIVERLVRVNPKRVVKIGVKFVAKLEGIGRLIERRDTDSWARTIVVDPPHKSAQA